MCEEICLPNGHGSECFFLTFLNSSNPGLTSFYLIFGLPLETTLQSCMVHGECFGHDFMVSPSHMKVDFVAYVQIVEFDPVGSCKFILFSN